MLPCKYLSLYYVLFHHVNTLNISTENIKHEKCLKAFLESHVTDNSNIFIQFGGHYFSNIFRSSFYQTSEDNFLNLINQVHQQNISINSFIFMKPNVHRLCSMLFELKASGMAYILKKYLLIVDSEGDIQKIRRILFHYRLYRTVILYKAENKEKQAFFNAMRIVKSELMGSCLLGSDKWVYSADQGWNNLPKNIVLNVVSSKIEPFIMDINSDSPGIMVDILKAFKNSGPIKVILKPSDEQIRSDIITTFNLSRLHRLFNSGYADVYTGPFDIFSSRMFDSSPVIYFNQLGFLIPKSLVNPLYEVAFASLGVSVYFVAVPGVLLYVLVFTNVARFLDDKRLTFLGPNLLMLYQYIIGVPSKYLNPRTTILRLYLGGVLIMSLQTSSIIQGKLASMMTGSPYVETIKNFHEMVESDLPIKMYNVARNSFPNTNETDTKRLLNKFIHIPPQVELFDISLECIKKRDFISITDESFLLTHSYAYKTHSYLGFNTLKITYFMPLNHPIYAYFCTRLQRIIQAGIVDNVFGLYRNKYELKEAKNIPNDDRDFVLTFKLLKLPFVLCFFGHILSIIAFVGELVYYRYAPPLKRRFIN